MSAEKEIHSQTLAALLLAPAAALTSTAQTTHLDTAAAPGFASALVEFLVGASGDTLSGSVFAELEVQETDDDPGGSPTWTPVPNLELTNYIDGATAVGTIAKIDAAGKTGQTYKVGYVGHKRYIRGQIRLTGTHTSGIFIAANALQGHPGVSPSDTVSKTA